ncbi:MAG TPA: hypothetical protein VEL07_21115 [Planctomycetota bacterium]|nr:hypothetical protein [Planctomycetota bacterium]
MRAAMLVLVLLLAACGKARQPIVTVAAAAAERRPMTLHVQEVHDTVRLAMATEAGISHLIEVAVVDGPDDWRGREVTLPYDEWQVGSPPPKRGANVTTSPARWVRGGGPGSRAAPKAGK